MLHQLVLIFITSTVSVIYGDDIVPNNADAVQIPNGDDIVPNNADAVQIPANMVTTADLELALRQVHENVAQLIHELMTTRAELNVAQEENQAHQVKMDEFILAHKAIQTADESTTKKMVEDIQTLQKQFKDLTTTMNQFTHQNTLSEGRIEKQVVDLKIQWNAAITSVNADIRALQQNSKRHAAGFQVSTIHDWLFSMYDQGLQILGEVYPKFQQAIAKKSSIIQLEYVNPVVIRVQEHAQSLYDNHAKVILAKVVDQAKPVLEASVQNARAHLLHVKTDVLPRAMAIFLTTREAIVMKTQVHLTIEMKPYTQVIVDFILTLLAAPLILLLVLQLLVLLREILRMITSIVSCCACCFCCCCRRRRKSPDVVSFQSKAPKQVATKTTRSRKNGSKNKESDRTSK